MKKSSLFFAVILISASSFAQFTFSVNPGTNLNSASFGYKIKKIVPYAGVQMFRLNGELNFTGKEYSDFGTIVDYDNTSSLKLNIVLPSLGVKYFFMERNKVQAYGNLNFSNSIISAKIKDGDNPFNDLDEDAEDLIESINFLSVQVGFGVEYFFDNNFSLGAEFGINMARVRAETSFEDEIIDPNTGNVFLYENVGTYKANFSPTYAKFSLNFYFGK